jgi:hypothetical protein
MIGPLLIGMLIGLLACAGLVFLGGSFWPAYAAYSVVGLLVTFAAALWCGCRNEISGTMPSSGSPDERISRKRQDEMDAPADAMPPTLEFNPTSRSWRAPIQNLRS